MASVYVRTEISANLRFIAILGLVSLFADWLYEGARSALPQFLSALGASALIVGLAFGLGDLLGYAARMITGPLADRRGGYWLETFIGYSLQVIAVLLLAFTSHLWVAVSLILLERFGKALRTPSRDVLIASAGGEQRGLAFGVHASIDQVGAVLGGLTATLMLAAGASFSHVFLALVLPGLVALALLLKAYTMGVKPKPMKTSAWSSEATLFSLSQFFLGLSLMSVALAMYQLSETPWLGALVYTIVMAAEIPASLVLGALYDRWKSAIYVAPLLAPAVTAAYATGSPHLALVASVAYPVVTAYSDVVAKAHVITSATALGMVSAAFGLGVLASGLTYGYLMDAGLRDVIPLISLVSAIASIALIRASVARARGTS